MSLVYVFNEGLLASLLINNKELHLEQFFSFFNPELHITVGEEEREKEKESSALLCCSQKQDQHLGERHSTQSCLSTQS